MAICRARRSRPRAEERGISATRCVQLDERARRGARLIAPRKTLPLRTTCRKFPLRFGWEETSMVRVVAAPVSTVSPECVSIRAKP
jgi:hypothetical protein